MLRATFLTIWLATARVISDPVTELDPETLAVLALDPALGTAVVRTSDPGLVVVEEGDEVVVAKKRWRLTSVLADRLVAEEIGGEGKAPAQGRRQVRIYKPRKPGLASRIEVLEVRRPKPVVADRDVPTEIPADAAAKGARAATAGRQDDGGRDR